MNFAPRYSEVLAALLQKRTRRITFLTRNFPFRQLVNIKTQTVDTFTPHVIFVSIHQVGANLKLCLWPIRIRNLVSYCIELLCHLEHKYFF